MIGVTKALNEFSKSEKGMMDCITAVSNFATETFVKENADAVRFVAETFSNFAKMVFKPCLVLMKLECSTFFYKLGQVRNLQERMISFGFKVQELQIQVVY
jgi:hypothetical protein